MAYTKILTAYDGSEQAIRALKTAITLAEEWKASLEVVHAYQIPVIVVGEAMIQPPVNTTVVAADEADNLADEVRSIISSVSPELQANVTVIQGEAGRGIVDTAEEKGADLIIIGCRGNSGLKELFLGSVSHYVIQHSKIDVHVVK